MLAQQRKPETQQKDIIIELIFSNKDTHEEFISKCTNSLLHFNIKQINPIK